MEIGFNMRSVADVLSYKLDYKLLTKTNVSSYNGGMTAQDNGFQQGGIIMTEQTNEKVEKDTYREMSNEEYREEIAKIFEGIEENYKLRWFYRFIVAKMKG